MKAAWKTKRRKVTRNDMTWSASRLHWTKSSSQSSWWEKTSRTDTRKEESHNKCQCAPHLIKPPWKKQKDKTYRIRMTCGSILWLRNISSVPLNKTCSEKKKERKKKKRGKFREIISKSTEQRARLGWRRKASSLSLSLSLSVIRARL